MKTTQKNWFAVSEPGKELLACASCSGTIDTSFMGSDHHPGICSVCGKESFFFLWENVFLQILTESAPPVVRQVIRYLQEELDELEFVELVVHLQEVAKHIQISKV